MSPLVRSLLQTGTSPIQLILRLGLGVVILPHGLQKVFGWFGGYGFAGTMHFFTDNMGLPWLLGLAAVLAESLGAGLLLAGLATRLAAAAIGITMVVAMLTTHVRHGFFMNWFGTQAGEGVEYFLLAIAVAAALVTTGGGLLSVDRLLAERRGARAS
jgi:putative oxidoreductase